MEIIGDYEYNSANRLGLGAFAIVFKGRSRKVSYYNRCRVFKSNYKTFLFYYYLKYLVLQMKMAYIFLYYTLYF